MLAEIKQYVGFTSDDARILQNASEQMAPHFGEAVEAFYDAIRKSPNAQKVFANEEQIERQKVSLRAWLETFFGGKYDDVYFAQRSKIGRVHVQVGLDQRYMVTGMSILRLKLHQAVDANTVWTGQDKPKISNAITKLCDIDLAIMMESYRDAYQERIQIGERLAALGQIAAAIGHDLRNPLAVIDTSAHLLQKNASKDPTIVKHVGRLTEQVTIVNDIITSLLSLTRNEPPARKRVNVRQVIDHAVEQSRIGTSIGMHIDVEPRVAEVLVEPTQFRQLFYNLIRNAAEALRSKGGTISIRVTREQDSLKIRVTDTGPGLPEEIRKTLFTPLVTTKKGGFGLGLALCRYIVEKHSGTITGTNAPGGGASFEIVVPQAIPN